MAVLAFDFLACVEIWDLKLGKGNPLAAPALGRGRWWRWCKLRRDTFFPVGFQAAYALGS